MGMGMGMGGMMGGGQPRMPGMMGMQQQQQQPMMAMMGGGGGMMPQQQQPMGMMGANMPGMMAPNPGMMAPNAGMMGPNPGMMGMQHSPLMMSNTPTPPPIHPSPAPAVGTPPVEWAIPQQKRIGYMAQFQVSRGRWLVDVWHGPNIYKADPTCRIHNRIVALVRTDSVVCD
jgi:hypothetical protein